MNDISLKGRIYNYISQWHGYDSREWVHGGAIENLAMEAGYKASNASRRCRELVAEGKIERKENEKGHVMYRLVPDSDVVSFINRESARMHQRDNQMSFI